MADITLVNTSLYITSDKIKTSVPLGPLYLTSYLEQKGFSVDFRDYQINRYKNPFDPQNLSDFVLPCANVAGFYCTIDLLPLVISTAKLLKERREDIFIVLGGPGPSGVAGEILQEFPFIDAVVLGEGEKTLEEILIKKHNLSGIQGACYRNEEGGDLPGRGQAPDTKFRSAPTPRL